MYTKDNYTEEQELYKDGEVNLKGVKTYLKDIDKVFRDINKVSKGIEKIGFNKVKVTELLTKKYNEEEAKRLISLYTQWLKVDDWKQQ